MKEESDLCQRLFGLKTFRDPPQYIVTQANEVWKGPHQNIFRDLQQLLIFHALSYQVQRASRPQMSLNPHRALKNFGDVHDTQGGFLAVDQAGHMHKT